MNVSPALWSAIAAFALFLLACQNDPAPPPTVAPTATFTAPPPPTPTATPMPTPTPTAAVTIAPTVALPTLTLTPPPTQPTATPPPTPTPAGPTLAEVPPTDGPILVEAMPSRSHFPSQLRISDVLPGGYSTVPPTSGQHWGAWSDCGFYNHPLPDELLVHNLEHGNIIVSYNLPDAADVDRLRAAVAAIPLAAEFAIVRRYLNIPEGMVALTTWGVLDRMMGVDADRIARFFADYPGNTGPEFPNGLPCTTGIDMTQSSGG